jgi:hypothetical protein
VVGFAAAVVFADCSGRRQSIAEKRTELPQELV